MPVPLHPQLKRGLDHDDVFHDAVDRVEELPRACRDEDEQVAKRQRVQRIAAQYLRGRLPVILTASLRGPFDARWKNPWAKPRRTKRRGPERERRTRSAGLAPLQQPAVASPETSRALHAPAEAYPGAPTPSLQQDETPSFGHFLSVDTATRVRDHSHLTSPFWLRRPESQKRVDTKSYTRRSTEETPTRTRGASAKLTRRRTVQCAMPSAVLSAAKPIVLANHVAAPVSGNQSEAHSTGTLEALDLENRIHTAHDHPVAASTPTLAPANTDPPSLEDRSPQSNAKTRVGTSRKGSHQENHRAPPLPDSSTAFVYKKVGSTKWSFSNVPRCKPRAVDFNSSPVTKEGAMASKPASQTKVATDKVASGSQQSLHGNHGQGSQQGRASQAEERLQEQQRAALSQSSRQSAMSTQAAMVLAQVEFQESTFPASSPDTCRPWSQSHEQTPRPTAAEPSPAITPLSVFRPQLEQTAALPSVRRGPPLSTQDLFAAASPFAFSTAKKKAEAPQRSNLRRSLVSLDSHDDKTTKHSPQSPSYSDRKPLQEKNVAPSPWRFSFGKGPGNSQDALRGSTGPSAEQ
ncbi:hypothetical protein ACEQ8H_005533 [Pleosporales sp. CAS-2024a]